MFKVDKIKGQLIYKYTIMMSLLFLIALAGNYILINYTYVTSTRTSVANYLREEVNEAIFSLEQFKKDPTLEPLHHVANQGRDSFYNFAYWFDADDRLIMADDLSRHTMSQMRELMKNWPFPENKVINLSVKDNKGKKWKIMIAKASIFHDGEFIGTAFVGTNLTGIKELQNRYLTFMFFLVVFLVFLSYIFASKMADRAMVPIIGAFKRQNKFVADASHEIRTPLSVMLSSIDLMEVSDEENIELKTNIKNELLTMRKLVIDLLEIARYDVSQNNLIIGSFDIVACTDSVIKSISILGAEKKINIRFDYTDVLMVNADEAKIKQIIYILLDNAIKYSPYNSEIFITLLEDKEKVKFMIEDEGVGVPKESQEHIFDRFYRVNKARSRMEGGTGLGLAIASEVIKLHGEEIGVESDGSNGSVFWFTLKK